MCGIVGIINGSQKIKPKLGAVFDDMLWADQIRGSDGGGVFWFDSRGSKYDVVKNEDISEVFNEQRYKTALNWIEKMPFMVGHNRAATRGSKTTENNHPFDEGNVVLVHNGTMTHIPKEFDDGTKVDSHAIAKMLHKASPQEFTKKSFGAYALVWFDKVTHKLNLLRNSQRPLHLVYFDDFILLSSEAMLAAWCASRNGHGYKRIEEVKEHQLYQFAPFSIDKPEITDLSNLKQSLSYHEHNYSGLVNRRGRWSQYGLDDDLMDVDGFGAACVVTPHQRSNVVQLPVTIEKDKSIEGARALHNATNPWMYFDRLHNIPVTETNKSSIRNGLLQFKKGDWINFKMMGGKEHGSFTHFLGEMAGIPSSSYVVRGNIQMTFDEVMDAGVWFVGQISDIKSKHSQITLYVKEVDLTQQPNVSEGGTEEKK